MPLSWEILPFAFQFFSQTRHAIARQKEMSTFRKVVSDSREGQKRNDIIFVLSSTVVKGFHIGRNKMVRVMIQE
jgi:hypothetical protein